MADGSHDNSVTYGSVCSGIEAATVAWEPLGWKAAWLAEIEPFPSAVLAHHYPAVPNLGDMTTIARRILSGEVYAPDILVGGTPCQAFSVAGARQSLDDARGNLTLRFMELANAIDLVRRRAGKPPVRIVWENVPGVLSTKDNAFGCFLGGLAGEDVELVPPGNRWSNVGCVYGPTRAIAWRTLDAQYFGLAQRRRRVFVVASARDGFDPAQVLFEWEGMRRDSSPRRAAGQDAASALAASAGHHGYSSPRGDGSDNLVAGSLAASDGGADDNDAANGRLVPEISLCLNAGAMGRIDSETETMIPVAFDSRQDPVSSTEVFGALGSSSPQAQAIAFSGVRRLTPVECERLQGFPDNYTLVEVRGKPAADGPRYKALGNSMATNVMAWIGGRLKAHIERIERQQEAA